MAFSPSTSLTTVVGRLYNPVPCNRDTKPGGSGETGSQHRLKRRKEKNFGLLCQLLGFFHCWGKSRQWEQRTLKIKPDRQENEDSPSRLTVQVTGGSNKWGAPEHPEGQKMEKGGYRNLRNSAKGYGLFSYEIFKRYKQSLETMDWYWA